jgi:hypothetical protein
LPVEAAGTAVDVGVADAVVLGVPAAELLVGAALAGGEGAAVVVLLGAGALVVRLAVAGAGAVVVGAGRTLRTCSMAGCAAGVASGVVSSGVTRPVPTSAAASPDVHSSRLPRPGRCRPEVLGGAVVMTGMHAK